MTVLKTEQKMFSDIPKKSVKNLGGGHQKITLDYRGEGGGLKGPKKDYVIFERSFTQLLKDTPLQYNIWMIIRNKFLYLIKQKLKYGSYFNE